MNDKTATFSAVAVDPCVMRRLLINLYNTAYNAGHHDTVEAQYTHVLPCDMSTYHEDIVHEWVDEYLGNELSALPTCSQADILHWQLHKDRLTAHWIWCAMERIATGEPEYQVMADYGYVPIGRCKG